MRYTGRRGEDADFEGVQAFAGVAVGELGEVGARVGVDLHFVIAEAALLVGEGAIDQLFELFDLERLELKNLGARNQRAVYVEKRVVGRGADQTQISALHIRQENVLLRLVEVMNFVDEQNRFLAGCSKPIRGSRHYPPHLRDVAFHSAEALEFRAGHVRDDLRERRFTGAGRAGQDDGRQPIGLNRAAQKFSRREDVFLPDKFFKGARAHAGSERGGGAYPLFRRIVAALKQILHPQKIRSANRSAPYIRAHAKDHWCYCTLFHHTRDSGRGIAVAVQYRFQGARSLRQLGEQGAPGELESAPDRRTHGDRGTRPGRHALQIVHARDRQPDRSALREFHRDGLLDVL